MKSRRIWPYKLTKRRKKRIAEILTGEGLDPPKPSRELGKRGKCRYTSFSYKCKLKQHAGCTAKQCECFCHDGEKLL